MIESTDLNDLVQRHGSWLETGMDCGPVVSSRVRLARNLDAYHFPSWAPENQRHAIWNQAFSLFSELNNTFMSWEMGSISKLDRDLLFERHLISQELVNKINDSGVFVSQDEMMSVMINEEDHIRIQALKPGLNLQEAWQSANLLDDQIEEIFSYAYDSKLGYLTSCPSNVGTGLRASVMLHLPGLVLLEEMDPVINGISKIGLAVRGMWGEGTEAVGNMFQVSNQITLGKDESQIINHLEQIVLELVDHEVNARERLMNEKQLIIEDHICRAFGLLSNSRLMTSNEALSLLSTLRLGLDLKLITDITRQEMDQLFISSQPAHLQKNQGNELDTNERDVMRSELLRHFMRHAKLNIEQE